MGISFRSTALAVTNEIRHIAQSINDTVSLNGAWFFQVKQCTQGKFKLLEFAPRQSSTMGLYRHTGVNFALLSLFNAMRITVELLQNQYAVQLDRCLYNRFKANLAFKRVYIDLDETLIVGRHVHEQVIAFVYQMPQPQDTGCTADQTSLQLGETLRDCGISEYLFERVIQLNEAQDKCDFIDPAGAIFIDNYWFDRRAVKQKFGIPVFDVDTIEALLH